MINPLALGQFSFHRVALSLKDIKKYLLKKIWQYAAFTYSVQVVAVQVRRHPLSQHDPQRFLGKPYAMQIGKL